MQSSSAHTRAFLHFPVKRVRNGAAVLDQIKINLLPTWEDTRPSFVYTANMRIDCDATVEVDRFFKRFNHTPETSRDSSDFYDTLRRNKTPKHARAVRSAIALASRTITGYQSNPPPNADDPLVLREPIDDDNWIPIGTIHSVEVKWKDVRHRLVKVLSVLQEIEYELEQTKEGRKLTFCVAFARGERQFCTDTSPVCVIQRRSLFDRQVLRVILAFVR